MNRIETQRILAFLCNAYPNTQHLQTDDAVEVWTRGLRDLTYTDASHAVSSWILSEKWCPTIADIREKVFDLHAPADIMASQAWNQLIRALRMSHAPESERVWSDLPEVTKLIVGGYATFRQWGNTETTSLESVQRPMFVKRYEELQRRERKNASLPAVLRERMPMIEQEHHEAIQMQENHSGERVAAPEDKMTEMRKKLRGGG